MRITFIGSGNVATHMAAALKNAGHRIVQVYSQNIQHAAMLAYHVSAVATDNISELFSGTDLFIIAVKDDAIASIAAQLSPYQKLTVHTSGATSLEALTQFTKQAGVFYPLQTFSKHKETDVWKVPLCIEGADEEVTQQLMVLARTVSNHVYQINTVQRKILHLSAVFACNFPNYLYYTAQQLLAGHNLDFNLLRPLINETASKVQDNLPAAVQTGPAVRNDRKTMEAHLQLLETDIFLQKLYQILSEGIIKMEKNRT